MSQDVFRVYSYTKHLIKNDNHTEVINNIYSTFKHNMNYSNSCIYTKYISYIYTNTLMLTKYRLTYTKDLMLVSVVWFYLSTADTF